MEIVTCTRFRCIAFWVGKGGTASDYRCTIGGSKLERKKEDLGNKNKGMMKEKGWCCQTVEIDKMVHKRMVETESTVKREMWNKWTEYCEVLKGKW